MATNARSLSHPTCPNSVLSIALYFQYFQTHLRPSDQTGPHKQVRFTINPSKILYQPETCDNQCTATHPTPHPPPTPTTTRTTKSKPFHTFDQNPKSVGMGVVEEAHNVKILGSGDQIIVLAHGFGTDQSVWKHLVPHLVENYKVVMYDNMGAGTTNPEYFDFDRYASLEGYAYDVIGILEEIGISSCIFVGHSVSAMIGAIASITRPDLFYKIIMISASPRYLNTVDYFGGFEHDELEQLFQAMQSNYKAWCSGFAPLAVGGDMDLVAVQEFSRTLFNMRPDIALSVAQTIFRSDLRHLLCHVVVPCHIIQSMKDLAVPVVVAEYLHQNLGGESIVEVMSTDGHLPQLSSPDVVVPVVLRHIRCDIAV